MKFKFSRLWKQKLSLQICQLFLSKWRPLLCNCDGIGQVKKSAPHILGETASMVVKIGSYLLRKVCITIMCILFEELWSISLRNWEVFFGRRHQVSRCTSRHDSGEACHVPAHSFRSDPWLMHICAPGWQIQLLWLGGRRTLSPTHQNRSRLSWHESRNACEGMRRRGEHSAHTLHRTRARRPPEANFRARRWLWTASHDDAPSQ